MSAVSDQLVQAESELIHAEARLHQAQQAGASGSVSEVLSSLLIQRLRADQAELERKIADARQTLGERNPKLIKLNAELDNLNSALRGETAKIIASLSSDVDAARTRATALRANLAKIKDKAEKIQAADVEIQAAQHEAQADRALFDRVLSRAKEMSVETGLQSADAEVIAHADVPQKPSFPNKPLFLAAAFVTSLVAAGLLVLVSESMDQGFRDLEDVERMLKVPALGFAPSLRRIGSSRPDTFVLEKPLSSYAEAIRGMYTSLMLSSAERVPKCILVTSGLPGEGKTSVAVSLARLMAASGKRVLLVDCDLRRRTASAIMAGSPEPGLVDYLMGRTELADVVTRDSLSDAWVLPAGSYPSDPSELLASEGMRNLLMKLPASYDLVIIDSSPVLVVSDTRNLCRLADKVVVAVRWQHTRKAAAAPAIRHIRNSGGDIAGVLLTIADTKRLPYYSASSYYVRQMNHYLPQ
jgi:capsular exopolysaccharide synthesis family protein